MSTVLQQTPAPPAPPAPTVRGPVDGEALARQIQSAVDQAIQQAGVSASQGNAAREGIRGTIEEIKAQIQEAQSQGVERIVIQPQFGENTIPPQAVDMAVSFFVTMAFIIVGLPIARAFARRMDRRGAAAAASPSDIAPRLDRIEQAIEAIAIEVERVSEGQRYTSKAISELRGLPSANPLGAWPSGAREAEPAASAEARRP